MSLSSPKNNSYCATIVSLKNFVELPGCDYVKAALIFGCSVIVGKDTKAGDIGLFFPVETALSHEFLSANNLYRKPEWGNVDIAQKGFFEQSGRVKAVRFRGHKSEGFWLPLTCLSYLHTLLSDMGGFNELLPIGTCFDSVGEHEICRKYIPRGNQAGKNTQQRGKQPRLEDSIVDGQFRFHTDTDNLRRNIHKIQPNDYISITDKWHGTSVVVGNLLLKRNLNLFERILRKCGVQIKDTQYGLAYSSRRVIKGVNGVNKGTGKDYYSEDIWGVVAKEVEDKIPNGFTLYGEIVGYTPNGSPIQQGYHYGNSVGSHQFFVYRVTLTTPDGLVVELSWPQMKEFCIKYGLQMVREIWYGRADSFYLPSPWDLVDEWQQKFLQALESTYVNDGLCVYNNNEVPAEGIVIRIDRLNECEAFKLKNFRFLEHESKQLDKGELDLETAESIM